MNPIRFSALDSEIVNRYRTGDGDAYGQAPKRAICPGGGAPCRHCLCDIEAGEPMLILAHRPFPAAQPYAETGPIFLHAEACPRYADSARPPAMFRQRDKLLMRGYDHKDRIVYGTGGAVAVADLAEAAAALLARAEVAYVHLRSAAYNCYQCRVDRAESEDGQ